MIVTVVWATPDVQDLVAVEVAPGGTVADAVHRCGLIEHYGLDMALLRFARFGVRVAVDTLLADGDRLEIVRRLVADPKAARVRRARAKAPPTVPPRNTRRPG